MTKRSSHKLTDEQKAYVVRRLAEYDKPVAIAQGLKEIFGVTISHQAIEHYDPGRPAGHDLALKWRDVFLEARRAFLERTADIGPARKDVRMRLRERLMMEEWEAGRCKTANEILDSIAKDAGGAFDSKHMREHFGFGGIQPIVTITRSSDCPLAPAMDGDDGEPDD